MQRTASRPTAPRSAAGSTRSPASSAPPPCSRCSTPAAAAAASPWVDHRVGTRLAVYCRPGVGERTVGGGDLRESERTMTDAKRTDSAPSRADLALSLGIAALVANVVGMFISGDDDSN